MGEVVFFCSAASSRVRTKKQKKREREREREEECSISPSRRSELHLHLPQLKLSLSPPPEKLHDIIPLSSSKPQDGSILAPRTLSRKSCQGRDARLHRLISLLTQLHVTHGLRSCSSSIDPWLSYPSDFPASARALQSSFLILQNFKYCKETLIPPSARSNLRRL